MGQYCNNPISDVHLCALDEKKRLRYRALDGNGRWVYGHYVHLRDSYKERETHRIYTGFAESDPEEFFPAYEEIDPSTLGQCTGVADINGKDIYEGDIVRYRWTDERHTKNPKYTIGTVVWNEFKTGWSLEDFITTHFVSNRLEAIGNIHTHPIKP